MYFRNYSLRKTWLHESVAGLVSEDPWAVNMLTGPKHSRNTQESTFILFFLHSDINKIRKRLH